MSGRARPRSRRRSLRKLDTGVKLQIASLAVGDTVQGNAHWFHLSDGGYVWAGGCSPFQVTPPPPPPPPLPPAFPVSATLLQAALGIVAPAVKPDVWVAPLIAAFTRYDVNNNKRIAVAIGQYLVEAGAAFQEIEENLTYTHADRIAAVFPREIPDGCRRRAFRQQSGRPREPRLCQSSGHGQWRRGLWRRLSFPWPRPDPAHGAQ